MSVLILFTIDFNVRTFQCTYKVEKIIARSIFVIKKERRLAEKY